MRNLLRLTAVSVLGMAAFACGPTTQNPSAGPNPTMAPGDTMMADTMEMSSNPAMPMPDNTMPMPPDTMGMQHDTMNMSMGANPTMAPMGPQTVQLSAMNSSGVSGQLIFRPAGADSGQALGTPADAAAGTVIEANVTGASPSSSLLVFLNRGSCAQLGERISPLAAIQTDAEGTGTSLNQLPVAFQTVMQAPLAVTVTREGGDTPADVLVCGQNTAAGAGM